REASSMKCFVIMPFGNPQADQEAARFRLVYEHWVKPTVEQVRVPGRPDERITCHRADRENRPGEVVTHVIQFLVDAEVVVADLTGRNPNVFYELGVRHSVATGRSCSPRAPTTSPSTCGRCGPSCTS